MPLSKDQAHLILSADAPARDLRIANKAKKGLPLTHAERVYVESVLAGDPAAANLPEYVSRKSDLAEILGVSRQRLQYHTRQPTFPRPDKAGAYRTAQVMAYARAAGLRGAEATAPPASDDEPDLNKERALLTRAQRFKVETENRKELGQLLEVHTVEAAWRLITSSFRQRILAIPSRLESECNLPPAEQKRVRAIIERLVDDALTELAKAPDYKTEDGPPPVGGA